MNKYDEIKVRKAIKSVQACCLHCEKCLENRCPIHVAWDALENLEKIGFVIS